MWKKKLTDVHGSSRKMAEDGGSWRELKFGYAAIGTAILAKFRIKHCGFRRPIQITCCIITLHADAEAHGSSRKLTDTGWKLKFELNIGSGALASDPLPNNMLSKLHNTFGNGSPRKFAEAYGG